MKELQVDFRNTIKNILKDFDKMNFGEAERKLKKLDTGTDVGKHSLVNSVLRRLQYRNYGIARELLERGMSNNNGKKVDNNFEPSYK